MKTSFTRKQILIRWAERKLIYIIDFLYFARDILFVLLISRKKTHDIIRRFKRFTDEQHVLWRKTLIIQWSLFFLSFSDGRRLILIMRESKKMTWERWHALYRMASLMLNSKRKLENNNEFKVFNLKKKLLLTVSSHLNSYQ